MDLAGVRELFAYNAWANRECFAALERLPTESYFRDLKSSHGGLHGTVCHIVWAEDLWLGRWRGRANPPGLQGKDPATLAPGRAPGGAPEAGRRAVFPRVDPRPPCAAPSG